MWLVGHGAEHTCDMQLIRVIVSIGFVTSVFWYILTSGFPLSLDKVPNQIASLECTCSHTHVPTQICVSDWVCFPSLPPLPFASQACVPVCLFLWLPTFLIIPFCTEKGLDL